MPYFPSILSDPQLGISKKDQNLILGAASSAWLSNKRNLFLYGCAIFAWATFMAVANVVFDRIGPQSGSYGIILWIISFVLFIIGSHYMVFHIRFRPYLYQELRRRGHDICSKCGYILIDIPESTDICPECGTPRVPLT